MAFGCKKSADGSDQVVYKGHVLFHGGIGRLTLETFPSGVFGGAFEIKHAGFVPMDIAFGGLLVFSGVIGVTVADAGNAISDILSFVGVAIGESGITVVLCSVKGGDTGTAVGSCSLLFPHADNASTAMTITNFDCFISTSICIE